MYMFGVLREGEADAMATRGSGRRSAAEIVL
jgi:hypothetical protein